MKPCNLIREQTVRFSFQRPIMFEIHINYQIINKLIIKLKKNYARTAVFRSSYFSRIVKMWSGLPLPVHQSKSVGCKVLFGCKIRLILFWNFFFSGGLPCMGIVSLLLTILMAPFLSFYFFII